MTSATTVQGERLWHYYRCPKRARDGVRSCPQKKTLRAEPLEDSIWRSIFGLLANPEKLRIGLEELIAQEQRGIYGDPDKQIRALADMLENVAHKKRRYQDMAAEGLIGFEELRSRLTELDNTCKTAEQELESLRSRQHRIAQLERDSGTFIERLVGLVPEKLESLVPEERHRVYKLLRLQAIAGRDGIVEVSGVIGAANSLCVSQTTSA